jgi:hypothetical protein
MISTYNLVLHKLRLSLNGDEVHKQREKSSDLVACKKQRLNLEAIEE